MTLQAPVRLLLCSALCVASAAAVAQSSVTLYGIVDTGIEYVSHANAAGGHVFRMPGVTGELPSRWGLRGAEDLGGGYSAVFTLENGFNTRGGDLGQGGRLFGRRFSPCSASFFLSFSFSNISSCQFALRDTACFRLIAIGGSIL